MHNLDQKTINSSPIKQSTLCTLPVKLCVLSKCFCSI